MQKHICYENNINNFNFSSIGSSKLLWIHYVLCVEMIKKVFLFELCFFFFKKKRTLSTFLNKVEKCLCFQIVCLSIPPPVHSPILVNFFQTS